MSNLDKYIKEEEVISNFVFSFLVFVVTLLLGSNAFWVSFVVFSLLTLFDLGKRYYKK